MEKIANHVHQYHGLHGQEARRVLRKKLATPAQVREHFKRKRPETESADIRAMFGQQAPAAGATAASVVRGKGKGKAEGDFKRKGKGKAGGEEASEGEGKRDSEGVEGSRPQESGTRYMGKHTGPFLEGFQTFLTSSVGGKKSERNAKEIVTNAAKYFYWCDPSVVDAAYHCRAKSIREYTEGLEGKVGPSGLQQYISNIEAALLCV